MEEAGTAAVSGPRSQGLKGLWKLSSRQRMREGLSSHNGGLCFRSLPVSQAPSPSVHLAWLSLRVSGCLPSSCPGIPDEMSLLPWAPASLLPRTFPIGRALKP